MNWQPTHQVVADELGLTVATVSRIRSGQRLPSLEVMQNINKLLNWSLDDQAQARDLRSYNAALNTRLEAWASQPATEDA